MCQTNVQVGIPWAHHPHPKILKEVRQAQMAQANASEHVFIVDALGLPLQSDNVHLTTEAQTTLGLMLVEKFNSVTDSCLYHPICRWHDIWLFVVSNYFSESHFKPVYSDNFQVINFF
jgi:hypothetical protein